MATQEAAHRVREVRARIRTERASGNGEVPLARALGWFSIGLGLTELALPGTLARLIGVRERRGLIRLLGLREIASGVGILANPRSPAGTWTRVAGDAMDLSLLGGAIAKDGRESRKAVGVAAAVAGVAILDLFCAASIHRRRRERPPRQTAILTVNRPPEECYGAWRDFRNLRRFMSGIESVAVTDERNVRFTAEGSGGRTLEWEAEIVLDEPGERIVWRSRPGSLVDASGAVRFDRAPGGRGTVVRLDLHAGPEMGSPRTRMFGGVRAEKDLLRFKQWLETGEISRTEGQPAGPRGPLGRMVEKGEKG